MKPSSRGLRSAPTARTNEPPGWTNAARPVLDFSDNEAGRICNDDAANAHFDDRHADLRDDVGRRERCARPDPAQGDGLPGPVQLFDLRGPTQKPVRQARSRDRAVEHAELRRAAQRAGQRRSSDRACRGRQRGGDGRTRQGGRRHRDRRRQRLQPHLRPAGDQRLSRTSRQDGRGRRAQYGLCAAAVQGAQGQRSQQRRLRGQAGRGHDGAPRGHDQGQGQCRGRAQSAVYVARQGGRLEGHGAAAKAIGAYQAGGAFVMREWAKANSDTLVRYIRAYVEGGRWALDPANKAEAIALLADRLKLTPEVAAQSYAVATDPPDSIAKDAKFDMEGFKNVLKLRAEIEGQWGRQSAAPGEICRSVVLQSGS